MNKDIRKEQLALLRIERKIAGLAAAVAAAGGAAAAADGKLHADEAAQSLSRAQDLLVQFAELTSGAHAALQARAVEVGARMFEASGGGLPKTDPAVVVKSILGIG